MIITPDMTARARGVLVGTGVGDALGVPYEFNNDGIDPRDVVMGAITKRKTDRYGWSDDTDMSVCVATATSKGLDLREHSEGLEVVAKAFDLWGHDDPVGIGSQTRWVIDHHRDYDGTLAQQMSRAAMYSPTNQRGKGAGNGALMRTAIIGVSCLDDPEYVRDATVSVARLTHFDREVDESCILMSDAVRRAIATGDFVLEDGLNLLDDDRAEVWSQRLRDVRSDEISLSDLGPTTGYTTHALLAAYSALHHSDNTREALSLVVATCADADTVAAITGAMLGSFLGDDAFDPQWSEVIHGWLGYTVDNLARLGEETLNRQVRTA